VVAEMQDYFERPKRKNRKAEGLAVNFWCTRLDNFRTILIDPPEEISELLEEIQSSFTHLITACSPQASRTTK
jgi:hypothetical protein